jgi:lysophospholipase L1-like esterase
MGIKNSITTNIVCFGDSITEGAEFAPEHKWTTLLQNLLEESFPQQYKVINSGVSGNTTADAIHRMGKDVIPYLPAIVLVQFGFNDCNVRDWSIVNRVSLTEYSRNIHEIYRIISSNGSQCIFVRNHSPDRKIRSIVAQGNGLTWAENFMQYDKALLKIIDSLNVHFIDIPSLLQKKAIHDIRADKISNEDGIHLTQIGNCIYAECIFEGIL